MPATTIMVGRLLRCGCNNGSGQRALARGAKRCPRPAPVASLLSLTSECVVGLNTKKSVFSSLSNFKSRISFFGLDLKKNSTRPRLLFFHQGAASFALLFGPCQLQNFVWHGETQEHPSAESQVSRQCLSLSQVCSL